MSDSRVRVCIVGSINMDLIVRAPRLPAAGETLMGGPFSTSPGGKGANQAVAAARTGAGVTMIGAVGDDAYGSTLRGTLAAEGIDVSHIAGRAAIATGVALITVAGDSENTIVVAAGANATVSPGDVENARAAITEADVLLMQLEVPLATVQRAAEIARDADVTVVLNAAPAQRLSRDLLGLLDALVVNRTEAAIVAGAPPGSEPALDMLGVSACVVTLGAGGARYLHGRADGNIAAYPVQPIDTVGAGDAFAGTLATRWAEHKIGVGVDHEAFRDILCWACAAGALATTKHGAIPSLPTRAEVVSLLRRADAQP